MQTADKESARLARQGDREAFGRLYEAYVKKIYDFLYFRTHHQQTAEDLTAQVFFKALDKIGSFDETRAGFSTWLYQIAKNSLIDHYRTFKQDSDIEDAWDISSRENILSDVDNRLKLEKIRELTKSLPKQQRDIVFMRVWDGLSHQEIAEILKISESNSRVIFSRALAKLQTDLVLVLILSIKIL